jgi:hypothetical protein
MIFAYDPPAAKTALENIQPPPTEIKWLTHHSATTTPPHQLPFNRQMGPTCGIYALDAAIQIHGYYCPPPTKRNAWGDVDPDYDPVKKTSMKSEAKSLKLSKIGEMSSPEDLKTLAEKCGYKDARVVDFAGPHALWGVVRQAIDQKDSGIVIAYCCKDETGEADPGGGKDSFTHWCLLFGYYAQGNVRHVIATTYGKYLDWTVDDLYTANCAIQDWPAQCWVRVSFMIYNTAATNPMWEYWYNESNWWFPENNLQENMYKIAGSCKANKCGFKVGSRNAPASMVELVDSSLNMKYSSAQQIPKLTTLKSVTVDEAKYSKLMSRRCLVV